jgi:voltage-gated potassium channel
MKSAIDSKISALEKFTLNDLSVDQLKAIREEIISRQSKLESDIDKITLSIKNLENSKGEHSKEFIPPKFSSPLRQVLIKQRDLDGVRGTNERYNDEIRSLDNIIQQKILHERQLEKLGSKWAIYAKESLIAALIILVLGAMFYELSQPNLSRELIEKLFWFDFSCCMVFLLNFFFELRLADSKKWYWKTHWIDFITSIPIPDAKILRAGRLLRLARLLRLLRFLRFFRVILLMFRGLESFKELFDMKLMKKTLFATFFFMLMGAGAILYFEQRPENLSSFIDGMWWSFSTIVVGGYGDIHNPVTMGGMLVTVMLVIAGMVLIGVFIATLSSILRSENDDEVGFLKKYMDKKFNEIENRIEHISKE